MEDKERLARIIQLHVEGKVPRAIANTIRAEGKPLGSTTVYKILRALGLLAPARVAEPVEEPEPILTTFEPILIDESTPDIAALAAEPDEPDEGVFVPVRCEFEDLGEFEEPDEPDEPDELSYQEIADSRKFHEFSSSTIADLSEAQPDVNQFSIDNFVTYVDGLIIPIEFEYIKLGESVDKVRDKLAHIEELAMTIASEVSEVDALRSTLSDYQKRIEELQEQVDAFQQQSLGRAMVVHGEGSLTESPPRRDK